MKVQIVPMPPVTGIKPTLFVILGEDVYFFLKFGQHTYLSAKRTDRLYIFATIQHAVFCVH